MITNLVLPFVWYTSDLFYWFLYFGSFLINSNELIEESNIKMNVYRNSDYLLIFNRISQVVESIFIKIKLIGHFFKLLNFKYSFRIIGILFLIGALGKFFLNFQNCVLSLNEILKIDELLKKKMA